MTDPTITSRPYSTDAACERCVFGSGDHEFWCEVFRMERCQWDAAIVCQKVIPQCGFNPIELGNAMFRAFEDLYQGRMDRILWGEVTRRAIREVLPAESQMPYPYDRPPR